MPRVAAIALCGLLGLVGSRASAQSFDLAGTRKQQEEALHSLQRSSLLGAVTSLGPVESE